MEGGAYSCKGGHESNQRELYRGISYAGPPVPSTTHQQGDVGYILGKMLWEREKTDGKAVKSTNERTRKILGNEKQ